MKYLLLVHHNEAAFDQINVAQRLTGDLDGLRHAKAGQKLFVRGCRFRLAQFD